MNSDSEEDYGEGEDRNPSPPPELQENVEASSGDCIGQTAFSKHWLFTTLMKLIKEVDPKDKIENKNSSGDGNNLASNDINASDNEDVEVDEETQIELCKLWDMSMNGEVATFLHEYKAIDILTGVIEKSKAPRVTEICVGILGNICCDSKICIEMVQNEKLVKMIFMLLKDSDPPTLTETTRLLYTCVSNKEAAKTWVQYIKADEEVRVDLQFILQSSTNSDLLKNTTEFIDVLLDYDEILCQNWAEEDLVISLLEAIKQVGYNHSETLEPYLHIFQLLSTNESGVEALVSCTDSLLEPLLKYLHVICEDEIVGLDGHESCLASDISVLAVLFSSSTNTCEQLLSSADLIRCLLKILDPLYPLVKLSLPKHTELNSACESTEDKGGEVTPNEELKTSDNNCENKDSQEVLEELRKLKVLYSVLQSFLFDLVISLKVNHSNETQKEGIDKNKNSEKTPVYESTLHYLDDFCSRERIYKMLYTLRDFEHKDSVNILEQTAKHYNKDRLQNIIKAFNSGKAYNRSESHHLKKS